MSAMMESIAGRILKGRATTTEIGVWLNWKDRASAGDVMEAATTQLLKTAHTAAYYRMRCNSLDGIFRDMPEPWKTLCADILANGHPRDVRDALIAAEAESEAE